jgi:hypothetical protein
MHDAIGRLVEAIRERPDPFVEANRWYGATGDEIRTYITQATVSRSLSDDSILAFSNFFSFLVSQAAALQEIEQQGKSLLYLAVDLMGGGAGRM